MKGERLTGWRRIANAMWSAPDDPQIYGATEIDAGPALELIERARAAGHHVTATHVVGRALAHALAEVPEVNGKIRGGKITHRETVDIFFIATVEHGRDLSGVKIADVARRPIIDVAAELARRNAALKQGRDRDFRRTKRVMDALPMPLLRIALRATAVISERLARDISALSLQHEPFGSAMVTNVGVFGLPQGFAPLAWMYDVPVLMLVGEIAPRAVVVDGRIEARPMMPITATIDHRYVDGSHIARLMTAFRRYLATPARFEPEFPRLTALRPERPSERGHVH